MTYKPQPVDTASVQLTAEILELTEMLAKNAHDIWASRRMAEGWCYGPRRDDARKEHPCLVPYEELPDEEREYDRSAVLETLKALLALGYRIGRSEAGSQRSEVESQARGLRSEVGTGSEGAVISSP